MLFFLLFYFILFVSVWPSASTLLRGYMRNARLGGNTPVIITVNKNLAKSWPEMFETDYQNDKFARSKTLLLVLLGKDKVFVRLLGFKNESKLFGSIMMERSTVHEIVFLNSDSFGTFK